MLRAVILGLLAVSAVSSCKGGSDSNQVAAGAVAGRVVEASGKVAATRDGKTRTLAVGSDVFRDDIVETGADGSLVIELAHNNARWSVEGNQKARVDESVAWGLAKQDKPAKVIDHATSAAGRDGERTAADTRATTESAPAPAAAAPPPAEGESNKGEAKKESGKLDQGRDRGVQPSAPEIPKPPPPPPPPRAAEPKVEKGAPGQGAAASSSAATADEFGGDATGAGGGGSQTRGGRVKSPQSIVETKRDDLIACAKGLPITLVVKLTAGKPTVMLQGSGSPEIRACVEGILAQLEFPAIDGRATLKLAK